MTGAAVCAACRVSRPMGALLAVTTRATGRVRFVCRPSLADQVPGRSPCFGILLPAAEESIELASDWAALDEQAARSEHVGARRANVAALAAVASR